MALHASNLKVGDTHEQLLVEGLSRTDIVRYSGASGSFGLIHVDEPYATEIAGYPSTTAHGMHTMGITSRAVVDFVGDGRLVQFGGRFSAMVWPGDTLTARCAVTSIREDNGVPLVDLDVVTVNQADVAVFTGYATARIDA